MTAEDAPDPVAAAVAAALTQQGDSAVDADGDADRDTDLEPPLDDALTWAGTSPPLPAGDVRDRAQAWTATGVFTDRTGRPCAAADLADPDVADGNCDSAAWAVHDAVDPDATSAHYFEIRWAGRRHAALVVATTDGPLVVDVAARQFDPAAPFPLIEPVPDYLRRTR